MSAKDTCGMHNDRLLKTGVIGSLIAALCCATPVLAVLLGALGLGWLVGYVDYVVLPVLVICLGLVGYALWRRAKRALEARCTEKETIMKSLLDKGGALGALMAALAAPCCFPLLAPVGFALGFGALLPWAEYALYGVTVGAVVAMVGSVIAFRSHRHLGWLCLGVGSGLLVIPALAFPWPPSVAYAGLLGLAVAAVANHVLVRRASCTVTPRSTAQRPSEVGSRV